MLKPLPTRKIDAALAKWFTTTNLTHKNVAWIDVYGPGPTVDVGLVDDNILSAGVNHLGGVKQLYGGNLDDVVRIEVFNRGYAVHLKTDVFDGDDMVCEVRVGGLC